MCRMLQHVMCEASPSLRLALCAQGLCTVHFYKQLHGSNALILS